MKILGIAEAGRGCVIGPMVVGGVLVDEVGLQEIEQIGVKDSKKLSLTRRETLAGDLKKIVIDYKLQLVSPRQIDCGNLNQLDLEAIACLIRKFEPQQVFFDVPTHPKGVGNFVDAVRVRLENEARPYEKDGPFQCRLVGENHADSTYPVVAAASILAKVERDRFIRSYYEKNTY